MRRLILLALTTTIAYAGIAGFHEWTPPAHAAGDSTCATHQLAAVNWGVADDHFTYSGDFQCGGAENLDYIVNYWLQIWNGSAWVEANCDTGPCESTKPSSGWWNAGTEHSWTWTFSFAGQIDCRFFRPQAQAHFRDGSVSQKWTGQERQTC